MKKVIKLWLTITIIAFLIPLFWDRVPVIKETAHKVLDPSLGTLLNWNVDLGLVLISLIIVIITTLIQKYATNQEEMIRLKKEQKAVQEQMKQFRDNPDKLLELQKKQLEFLPQTLELSMSSTIYTIVPLILLFRWFADYFITNPVKIFGFFSWIWAYILFSIIISIFVRKLFKMP